MSCAISWGDGEQHASVLRMFVLRMYTVAQCALCTYVRVCVEFVCASRACLTITPPLHHISLIASGRTVGVCVCVCVRACGMRENSHELSQFFRSRFVCGFVCVFSFWYMGRMSEACVVLSVLWRICVIIAAKRFLLISEAEKIYGAHALARVNDVRVNISKCVNYYTVNQPTLA